MANECIAGDGGGGGGVTVFSVVLFSVVLLIALSAGTSIDQGDFAAIWKNKKRALLVGFTSQYGFLPLVSFLVVKALQLPELTAVSVLLLAICPSGAMSNLLTQWTNGNVALSVCMSATSTIIAVVSVPVLFAVYVKGALGALDSFTMPYGNLITAFVSLVIPVSLGALIRRRNTQMKLCGRFLHEWLRTVTDVISVIFLSCFVIQASRENEDLFNVAKHPKLWIIGCLFVPTGFLFGLSLSYVVGLDFRDARAVAFETGHQNIALGYAIIDLSFSGCVNEELKTFLHIAGFCGFCHFTWPAAFAFYKKRCVPVLDTPVPDAACASENLGNT